MAPFKVYYRTPAGHYRAFSCNAGSASEAIDTCKANSDVRKIICAAAVGTDK